MRSVEFVFAVHDHQPVGNFEYVLEDIYRRAYAPFLSTLERHPGIRCTLHRSGALWEWLEKRHPEHVDLVGELAQRGQIELLSGAYYDPLLPAISERDRRGQIDKLSDFLERRFGGRPRGAWVAERVWEPHVAATLVDCGVEYVFLDDTHFEAAGLRGTPDGWYFCEHQAQVLRVLPIHAALRYRVPFAAPQEALAAIADFQNAPPSGELERADEASPALAVHADDGEKFGAWPGTHVRCYEEGWLDRFFDLVESSQAWLRTATAGQCLARLPGCGRIDLPAAAYPEFEAWALDPEAQRNLQGLRARLVSEGQVEALRFLRGGSWRHFLVRYPESNWMHKRVLRTADAVWRRIDSHGATPGALRARDEVWRAQCNCAYWHGLFGGLYLSHLRSAVYGAMLRAERWLADGGGESALELLDVDADGRDEIVLRSADLQAFVKPDVGGMIVELDDRLRSFNLIDTLARRAEAYHSDRPGAPGRLDYDSYRRGAAVEHLLASEAMPADFAAGRLPVLGATAGHAFDWVLDGDGVRLERAVALRLPGSPVFHLEKHLRVRGPALELGWELWHEGGETLELRLGIEIAANFLAGDAPDRYYSVPDRDLDDRRLSSSGTLADVRRIDLVDEWLGIRARIECDTPCAVWRTPIETVSSSENGPERLFQGSAMLFVSPVRLEPLERVARRVTWTIERT